jgi:hypothetical protein
MLLFFLVVRDRFMKFSLTRPATHRTAKLLVLLLTLGCMKAFANFAPFELQIIQPMSGLDANNRYYRAYPGLVYDVQISAIGGEYPFQYELVSGPDGMSVARDTGVIAWTPSDLGTETVTVKVIDNSGATDTVTWPITVTREKFLFVDSTNGSSYGSGTIDDPLRTVADIYGGTHYDAKRAGTYRDHFVYFREGSYVLDGYREDPRVQWTYHQPVVMMAYPGETPDFDLSSTYLWADTQLNNFYLEGINVTEMATKVISDPDSHKGFRITGSSSNVTFRNNKFNNLALSDDTYNNQSVIMATAANPGGKHWAIIGNEFRNVHRAYGIVGYAISRVNIEKNLFDNFTHGKHAIGPKKSCEHWYIRDNRLTNIQGDAIWLYWAQESDAPFGNMEISYNYTQGIRALLVNQKQASAYLPIHVFRNTFDGTIEFRAIDSSSADHFVHNNIIVNNTAAANGVAAGIECSLNCSGSSRIRMDEDNLVYTTDERPTIIDSSGKIVSSKRDDSLGILGHYGWERYSSSAVIEPEPSDSPSCAAPHIPILF